MLYVGRPVQGQPGGPAGLFKMVNGGSMAERIEVKLGRSSVSVIEIVEGLQAGDQIILSDMSQWDAHHRVRLGYGSGWYYSLVRNPNLNLNQSAAGD